MTFTSAYANAGFRRALRVRICNSDSPGQITNGRLTFEVEVHPGNVWHTCLCHDLIDGERVYEAPSECFAHAPPAWLGSGLEEWRNAVLKLETGNEEFYRLFRQSVEDMASLRLPIEGTDHLRFVAAGGVPWFVTLFGRDSLIAALQTVFVYPDFARGALEVLGEQQATEIDDYRDAEPGRILHEQRHGELASLRKVPHTPYYGTADATPLYIITLHVAWHCIGDRALLERHLGTAERCLAWIDHYGDRDGDGFQEYATRSPVGLDNQGWKDSGDSVMHPDGSPVEAPKALCELQGYVYDAWLRMAEIYDALGRPADAARLRGKAADLYRHFDEAFWDEETGFYAYCLDAEKRKVLTVASNPGHLLWSGIVPPEKARRVVDRLMRPDMWSGWGIRTLSAEHPSYNPFSYQNGSVWPHDNGLIALGFKRYGFHDEAAQVARDISEAASFFMLHQMPELYAGIQRDGANFPVQYAGANVPQAWAAGTVFFLLQAIVGFQPTAEEGVLYLDPWLPSWLPGVTLRDLRIGAEIFAIRIEGSGADVTITVLAGDAGKVRTRSIVGALAQLKRGGPDGQP
jgi:glycogen debranching enzyme